MHHVLIVDDDEKFTDALAKKLKREGYQTTVVHDGDAALSELQAKSNVDLVFSYWFDPGVNPSLYATSSSMPGGL